MQTAMTVLQATHADIPTLKSLVNGAYRGDSSRLGWTTEADLLDGVRTGETELSAMLDNSSGVVLISRDEAGTLTGCVCVQREKEKFYLGMLTVAPALQAKGIGKQLMQAAEHWVIQASGHTVAITVISERHELIAWYERHGYCKTGETKPFPADPAFGIPKQPLEFVVMTKKI